MRLRFSATIEFPLPEEHGLYASGALWRGGAGGKVLKIGCILAIGLK